MVDNESNDEISVEQQIEEITLTKKKMTTLVEKNVQMLGMSYTDAVISICEERVIDPEDIGNMISPAVRDKIEAEAVEARMIKGESQLPI